ncbi:hypothetical protein CLU81_0517 [Flavobacterium sp. 9]|nr:hypothetical protein CLU81_0517 [Flavobacterium sp. 9]
MISVRNIILFMGHRWKRTLILNHFTLASIPLAKVHAGTSLGFFIKT